MWTDFKRCANDFIYNDVGEDLGIGNYTFSKTNINGAQFNLQNRF